MSNYTYDTAFLQYASQSSAYAARIVTTRLASLAIDSVLDVGCAAGTWLRAWSGRGVEDYHGVDGDYVERGTLEIPVERFTAIDLNRGFDLGRQFDLVQSLEVAEHIRPEASGDFIDCLSRHARRYVLFSAAPPGQGGEHHVNERSYEFWRKGLARHGFAAVDMVRPAIIDDQKISFWYRYNMILYVRRELLGDLAREVTDCIVAEETPLADVSPLAFRVRKAIVRRLPSELQDRMARLKSRLMPTGRF